MSHLCLFVGPFNNLAFITKYPHVLFHELSNSSSHDTIFHVLFYLFHELRLSPLQASLHILIFNNFCTKSMVPIVLDYTSNMYSRFFLWSLKINIPLHKQSVPVGLFPVDVLNLCGFCFKIILYTVEVLGISDPIPLFLVIFSCGLRLQCSALPLRPILKCICLLVNFNSSAHVIN